jgi:integrase
MVAYKSMPDRKVKKIIPNFSPYALRHTAASQWIEMNLLPKRIQALMGHTDLKMTMDTYGHLWQDPEADNEIAIGTERAFA